MHYWHQQQSQPRAFFIRSFFIPRVSLSWRVQASCSLELKRQGWVELERGARGAADATASEGIGKFFLFSHDQKLLYRGFEHNFYFRNTLESFPQGLHFLEELKHAGTLSHLYAVASQYSYNGLRT